MCLGIWSQEKDCICQWESNLSRKTSRRNRMEARYQRHLNQKKQEKLQKDLDNQQKINTEGWRKYSTNDSSDEEIFWVMRKIKSCEISNLKLFNFILLFYSLISAVLIVKKMKCFSRQRTVPPV